MHACGAHTVNWRELGANGASGQDALVQAGHLKVAPAVCLLAGTQVRKEGDAELLLADRSTTAALQELHKACMCRNDGLLGSTCGGSTAGDTLSMQKQKLTGAAESTA